MGCFQSIVLTPFKSITLGTPAIIHISSFNTASGPTSVATQDTSTNEIAHRVEILARSNAYMRECLRRATGSKTGHTGVIPMREKVHTLRFGGNMHIANDSDGDIVAGDGMRHGIYESLSLFGDAGGTATPVSDPGFRWYVPIRYAPTAISPNADRNGNPYTPITNRLLGGGPGFGRTADELDAADSMRLETPVQRPEGDFLMRLATLIPPWRGNASL